MSAILLVEDSDLVRATLHKFLVREGHDVTDCASGDEATQLLKQGRFDLVVADLWMQGGDGLQFIRQARASGNAVPIIAITGGDPRSPIANSAKAAGEAGADRVLMKPFAKTTLTSLVGELLEGQNCMEGHGIGL